MPRSSSTFRSKLRLSFRKNRTTRSRRYNHLHQNARSSKRLAARQRRLRVCHSGKKVKLMYRRRSIKSLRRRSRRIGGTKVVTTVIFKDGSKALSLEFANIAKIQIQDVKEKINTERGYSVYSQQLYNKQRLLLKDTQTLKEINNDNSTIIKLLLINNPSGVLKSELDEIKKVYNDTQDVSKQVQKKTDAHTKIQNAITKFLRSVKKIGEDEQLLFTHFIEERYILKSLSTGEEYFYYLPDHELYNTIIEQFAR